MLILAFVAFFVLVLAWLIAPNGEVAAAPAAPAAEPASAMTMGEASV